VLSAPSGTGKSTLARALVGALSDLEFSVSFTTRGRREAERDGIDYHFVDRERFEAMVATGALLEWAPVFDQLYGTGREVTEERLAQGKDLLLDIDVQGARQIRTGGLGVVTIMLLPPDFATLEARLRQRGSEGDESVMRRLSKARREAEAYREFDYVVINQQLEQTLAELASIVRAERRRVERCADEAQRVIASFPR
jgi:guanylate kinase